LSEYKYEQFWELWEIQWAQSAGVVIDQSFKDIFNSLTSPQAYTRLSITEIKHSAWFTKQTISEADINEVKREMKLILKGFTKLQ
jgi:hypothetical protein